MCLSVCLSVYVSLIYVSVCVCLYLPVYMSVCIYFSLSVTVSDMRGLCVFMWIETNG